MKWNLDMYKSNNIYMKIECLSKVEYIIPNIIMV